MHIMEGYLPVKHALGWSVVSAPFVILGVRRIQQTMKAQPKTKLLLGAAGAYAFVLSALKLPSVTGSCSHPTGIGLGATLFGPLATCVLGVIVLLFQAILLAHGGLTTLGANVFSMAIVGSFTAYGIYRLACRMGVSVRIAVFLAAFLSDLATYVSTSIQLAMAFPDPISGFGGSLVKFMGVFAVTQLPLAVSEGLLTVVVMNMLTSYNRRELEDLNVLQRQEIA